MKRINMMLVALFGGAISLFADILPTAIRCEVEPVYKYRADSLPGRVVSLFLRGNELKGKLQIYVTSFNKRTGEPVRSKCMYCQLVERCLLSPNVGVF